MKTNQLIKIMEHRGIKLPEHGSGRNGRIVNADLEDAIADYWCSQMAQTSGCNAAAAAGAPADMSARSSWGTAQRLKLRSVMLAARYADCPEDQQALLFEDDNEWVMEEKYNGVRITLFGHPDYGFSAFSRNRGARDFLPLDYTNKLLVKVGGKLRPLNALQNEVPHNFATSPRFMVDCELVTADNGVGAGFVELPDGSFAKGLPAVVSVLQSTVSVARTAQRTTCPLQLVAFDCLQITPRDGFNFEVPYRARRKALENLAKELPFLELSARTVSGKRRVYETYIRQGKEGVVFKAVSAPYVPGINGRRDRNACVKLKRALSDGRAVDIDAFVMGDTLTPEWAMQGLVGALELGVFIRREGKNGEDTTLKLHHIATVSAMPLEVRRMISGPDGRLKPEYFNRVLVVDGQDISARNRRISHARVDWGIGFRTDKEAFECILDEVFIESQVF